VFNDDRFISLAQNRRIFKGVDLTDSAAIQAAVDREDRRLDHYEVARVSVGAMKELKRLVDAVEHLRAEVEGLTERMEYTGSLLDGPKAEE